MSNMITTLILAIGNGNLQEIIKHLTLSPLEIDVALYDGQSNGEIEVDKSRGVVSILKQPDTLYSNLKLEENILKIIGYYNAQSADITLSRLEQDALDPVGGHGYKRHDLYCTLYKLENEGKINKYEISVPAIKKPFRPANTFIFYTLTDHQEFGSKATLDFIKQWDKLDTKK